MSETIHVIGVSGFVGKTLAIRLLEEGYTVVRYSRNDPSIPGVKHVSIDLTTQSFTLYSEETVINCAADTRDGLSKRIENNNYNLTLKSLEVTKGKVIHISSSSVYDLTKPNLMTREEEFSKVDHYLNSYSKGKGDGEKVLMRSVREAPLIILRPHAIYGEGDTTLMPRLEKRIINNKIVLPGNGLNYHSLTNVDNLVDAIILALNKDIDSRNPIDFNITDSKPIRLIEAIRLATGQGNRSNTFKPAESHHRSENSFNSSFVKT